MEAHEYKMGSFMLIDYPFTFSDGEDLCTTLKNAGYSLETSKGDDSEFELWASHTSNTTYAYWGIICFDFNCHEVGFPTWIDALHFMENYTSWIKPNDQIIL